MPSSTGSPFFFSKRSKAWTFIGYPRPAPTRVRPRVGSCQGRLNNVRLLFSVSIHESFRTFIKLLVNSFVFTSSYPEVVPVTQTANQATRRMTITGWFDTVLRDLKYTFRMLARTP